MITAETARRLHAFKVGKIDVADRPQRVCGGTRLKVLRQRIQPCPVIVPQGEKLGHANIFVIRIYDYCKTCPEDSMALKVNLLKERNVIGYLIAVCPSTRPLSLS